VKLRQRHVWAAVLFVGAAIGASAIVGRAVADQLDRCYGNACDAVSMSEIKYRSQGLGTQPILYIKYKNNSMKTVQIEVNWSDALGGTGTFASAALPPGQEKALYTANELTLGVNRVTANY
jgi:hypothetical protein